MFILYSFANDFNNTNILLILLTSILEKTSSKNKTFMCFLVLISLRYATKIHIFINFVSPVDNESKSIWLPNDFISALNVHPFLKKRIYIIRN